MSKTSRYEVYRVEKKRPLNFDKPGFDCDDCGRRVQWVCLHGLCSHCFCVDCSDEGWDEIGEREYRAREK
jgi:hypothetical protein